MRAPVGGRIDRRWGRLGLGQNHWQNHWQIHWQNHRLQGLVLGQRLDQRLSQRRPVLPGLFVLTDPQRMPDPVAVAARLPAGCGLIYRHFGAADRGDVALALRRATAARSCRLLIARDPDLALGVGADGVHWPEDWVRLGRAWRRRAPQWLMTGAAHTRAAIRRGAHAGLDGVFVSPVFGTRSGSGGVSGGISGGISGGGAGRRPLGPMRFARLAMGAGIGVYALGGVRGHNVARIAPFAAGFGVVDAAL